MGAVDLIGEVQSAADDHSSIAGESMVFGEQAASVSAPGSTLSLMADTAGLDDVQPVNCAICSGNGETVISFDSVQSSILGCCEIGWRVFERRGAGRQRRANRSDHIGSVAEGSYESGFSLSHDEVIDACIEAVDRAGIITDDRSGRSIVGRRLILRSKQAGERKQASL